MNFNTYKNNLLSYLHDTEEYEKQDIEDHRNLSDDEKEKVRASNQIINGSPARNG